MSPDAPRPAAARRGPARFDEGDPALAGPALHPAEAPPPPDPGADPAAIRAMRAAARAPSTLGRWFWGATGGLISLALGVAAYDFVTGLFARNAVLGGIAASLGLVAALALAVFALREMAGLARLGRVDGIRAGLARALREGDRAEALRGLGALRRLYAGRPDLEWGLAELARREPDLFDADGLIAHAERTLMTPLDARAEAAVTQAARTVAMTTAMLPIALVDVFAALATNLRMIRAVAEAYGGRAGWLGSWRLLRAVAAHLIATGAVALGDDLIGPALGGSVMARVSRRFGEGMINGALTARVGAAAIEVCRPLPFHARPRPSGRGLAAAALRGAAGMR